MLLLGGWALMALVMLTVYLISRRMGNAGIVDVAWSAGVGLLALAFAALATGDTGRRILTAALAAGWSLRLAWYLLADRVLGEAEEDGRYRMLREKWRPHAERNFAIFFQVQAVWAVLFAAPLLPAMYLDAPLGQWFDLLAGIVWLIAVGGEALADRQLSRFRRRPDSKGKTCREGLWRYSRHPNYFFEWLHWFTYVLLAWSSPWVWFALLGPAVMLAFLYKVTGIPYTEKRAIASRGEDYRRYQQTTSAFIPLPPRKRA
jgi:steroid 5-alpha reductase family enzyme